MLSHVTSRVRYPHGLKVPTVLLFECLLLSIFSLNTDSSSAEPPPSDQGIGSSPQQVARTESSPRTALELIKEEESVSIAIGLGREQPISKSPSNVYVITDEDIRHSGAIDLPTILRRIPGMEVIQTTGADFNVSVRGDNQLQANKLLVLVDGRSIYFDMQGQVFWKSIPVTLPEIQRIEVLKGPASVLYGFNAFDGVINIITKSPQEMKGTTIQFGGGEYGTISSAAIHAGTYKNIGYRLSVGSDQTNQWSARDGLAFRDYKFNGQFDYRLKDGSKLSLTGGLVDTNRYDGAVNDSLHNSSKIVNGYTSVLYEQPNLFLRGWWQRWNHDQTNNVDPRISRFIRIVSRAGDPTVHTSQESYNLEGQHRVAFTPQNHITYGFTYRHNTGSSNYITGLTREDRLGFYIHDEWRPTTPLTVTAGVRMDMDTFINPTYSPRGAILYEPFQGHTFRLAGSVAYRPPTMFETSADSGSRVFPPPGPPGGVPGSFRGSESLVPEKIMSFELGYQGWFLKHTLRLRGDLFFNHISDLISSVRVSTTPSVLSFVNSSGAADIHGLEVGIEYLATTWLSGFVNYTYQEIGQSLSPPTVRRGAPSNKVSVGIRGESSKGLSGEAVVHYVGQATYPVSATFAQFAVPPFNGPPPPSGIVDSYTLLNLRGAYLFWKEEASSGLFREAELAVSAFNALNDKHREHPLGDIIGSRVMGWLTLKM